MERQIPHSLESESAILGSMILDNSIIPKILSKITEESFFIDSHRALYSCLARTYDQKKKVDAILLKDSVTKEEWAQAGGTDKIMDIMQTTNHLNWEGYLATIKEKEELRRYLTVAESATASIYSGTGKLDHLRGSFLLAVAKGGGLGERSEDLHTAGANAMESMERWRTEGVDLTTGWREIDGCLGGLRRKEMSVVGGKMSNAKTTVAMNIAVHLAAEGKRVLINAFENRDQVPTRMASIISGVPLEHFVKPHLATEEEYAAVCKAMLLLDEYKANVLVMDSASVLDMRGVCDVFKPDCIIVDYLQKYGQRYCTGKDGLYAHEIGKVASDIQDLAKDFNAHSLLFSRLARRESQQRNRPPEVPDLKESGDIENCADNILLLWWPWRDQPESGKDPQEYYIYIAKNKLGPVDKKVLRIDVRTLSIRSYGG